MSILAIHGSNIGVTDSIRAAAEEKLKKITNINPGTSAILTFKKEGEKFEAHLTYHINNKDIVAKKSHEDLYVALKKVFETVLRQVRKSKVENKGNAKVADFVPIDKLDEAFDDEARFSA